MCWLTYQAMSVYCAVMLWLHLAWMISKRRTSCMKSRIGVRSSGFVRYSGQQLIFDQRKVSAWACVLQKHSRSFSFSWISLFRQGVANILLQWVSHWALQPSGKCNDLKVCTHYILGLQMETITLLNISLTFRGEADNNSRVHIRA